MVVIHIPIPDSFLERNESELMELIQVRMTGYSGKTSFHTIVADAVSSILGSDVRTEISEGRTRFIAVVDSDEEAVKLILTHF